MTYGPGPGFYKRIETWKAVAGSGRRRILIVEDERLLCWSISRNLTREGTYDTVCVESGVEALRFLESLPFDLVILDNRLPGLSGMEVMARLQERGIRIPVIMISASNDPNLEVEAHSRGALLLLRKPFKLQVLEAHVRDCLSGRAKGPKERLDHGIGDSYRADNGSPGR